MKLFLVDGTYELFRAYYGGPPAKNAAKKEVGATRTLLKSLLKLVLTEPSAYVAVAFDRVIESFRNTLFGGYKTGEGIEPDLWAQFPLAEEACTALGIVTWPMTEFEADDALATAARKFSTSKKVDQTVICSVDKDLAQCVVGKKIVLWDRMRDKWLDEKGVGEKFGVGPSSIPDYLALVGDSADGIPGIARWGAKSTACVLAKYKKLEKIPDQFEKWDLKVRGGATLCENLSQAREDALLYRKLATLRLDVPLKETLSELHWKGFEIDRLSRFCEEIGERRLIERLPTMAGALLNSNRV